MHSCDSGAQNISGVWMGESCSGTTTANVVSGVFLGEVGLQTHRLWASECVVLLLFLFSFSKPQATQESGTKAGEDDVSTFKTLLHPEGGNSFNC